MTKAMTRHITGVTRFELPLRGESLAAWLNSFFITSSTSENREQSCPTARRFRVASGFDGAGCAALTGSDAGKLSIRPASSFAWVRGRPERLRGIGGMLVMRRRIEFLSHWMPPFGDNARGIPAVPSIALAKPTSAVYQERQNARPATETRLTQKSARKTLYRSSFRPQADGAADLDDAAGRPLSAGIS